MIQFSRTEKRNRNFNNLSESFRIKFMCQKPSQQRKVSGPISFTGYEGLKK